MVAAAAATVGSSLMASPSPFSFTSQCGREILRYTCNNLPSRPFSSSCGIHSGSYLAPSSFVSHCISHLLHLARSVMSATEFSLRQRPSKPSEAEPPARPPQGKSSGNTITYEESLREVPWQTDNRYIRKGYRRRLQDVKSVLFSLIGCESLIYGGPYRLG